LPEGRFDPLINHSPPPPSVLLVGDDSAVREWVQSALRDSEFDIAGEALTAEGARALAAKTGPDLLLIDARDDAAGSAFVRELRERGLETPTIVMTESAQRGLNENARAAGAQGSLLKTGSIGELLATLRKVLGGDDSFDVRHPQRPPGRDRLSPRERDVLELVSRGATNREIARQLGIGEETVKTLLARSSAKLGVHGRNEAATAAHGLGLL
jgi:DNA-binding NarL/FixJ family response regulator